MKNKSKLGLSLLTGLSTLSVAMPLATSCAKTNKRVMHVHESEEDKLYGINANTYESLKKDYTNQYQDKLLERGYIEGSEEWNNEINKLNYSLQVFDEKSNTIDISYGQLTNGLMTYAKRTNGLSLCRTTAAKPSDVDDMYQGARNSFDLYMDQLGFSSERKAAILDDADEKFATLKTQLQEKGTMENDPYGALQEAKSSLMGFFELINAKISRFASMVTISNFKKLYTLAYKNTTYLNDLLKNEAFKVGEPISNDLMNQIFECIDAETGSKTTFRNDIMAGYVLTPTLKEVKIDNKTNKHEIDIQWSCISNTYINSNDAETVKTATAYEYETVGKEKADQLLKLESPSVDDVFKVLTPKASETLSHFDVNNEKGILKNAYFNPNTAHITFKFPEASDPHAKLDPFYISANGIKTKDGKTVDGWLSIGSLADAGLMISSDSGNTYEHLSDVIQSVNADGFDSSKATLAQQFASNCELYAKVHEENKAKHEISVQFYAIYANSSSSRENLENQLEVGNGYCSGYPISNELFEQYSKDFSTADEYVNCYRNSKIKDVMNSLIPMEVFGALFTGINLALTAYSISIICTTHKGRPMVAAIVALASCLVGLSMTTYGLVIYSMYIDRCREFSNEINKFNKSAEAQALYAKLDEGSKIFVKFDPDSNYTGINESNSVYNAKYDVFKNGDIEYFTNLDSEYKLVNDPNSPFNTRAKSMEIDISKDSYSKLLNDIKNDVKMKVAKILIPFGALVTCFASVLVTLADFMTGRKNDEIAESHIGKTILWQKGVEVVYICLDVPSLILVEKYARNLILTTFYKKTANQSAKGLVVELEAEMEKCEKAWTNPCGLSFDECVAAYQKDHVVPPPFEF